MDTYDRVWIEIEREEWAKSSFYIDLAEVLQARMLLTVRFSFK